MLIKDHRVIYRHYIAFHLAYLGRSHQRSRSDPHPLVARSAICNKTSSSLSAYTRRDSIPLDQ